VDLVERVGSYVGFAAFLGLAILALLYFSQARDVRRLRDWAGRAPERALGLEQGDRATEVAPATPAAQHSLPATPFAKAAEPRRRKPLRERIRNVHIPYGRYIAMAVAGLLIAGGAARQASVARLPREAASGPALKANFTLLLNLAERPNPADSAIA